MKKIIYFLSSILLLGCYTPPVNGYKKYTVKKGSHNSAPLATKVFFKKCNIKASAYFTESSKYNLGTEDQADWNKLSGFKLDYNNIPNNAAMIVWRYNVSGNYWEIAPYFNNYGIVFPANNQIIKVNDNETFSWTISLQGDIANISITKGNVTVSKALKLKQANFFTSVSLWFGGNMPAPNDISIFIKY